MEKENILFEVTTRVANRLRKEAFQKHGHEVYGEKSDFLTQEESFNSVRSSLCHLLHQCHYPTDDTFFQLMNIFCDGHRLLIAHPGIKNLYSSRQLKRLDSLYEQIVSEAQKLRKAFTKIDIDKFIAMATAGRLYFSGSGYVSSGFLNDNIFNLATLICQNFQAYEKTLNDRNLVA